MEEDIFFKPFIRKVLPGSYADISFVDFVSSYVCRNRRVMIRKTFEGNRAGYVTRTGSDLRFIYDNQ